MQELVNRQDILQSSGRGAKSMMPFRKYFRMNIALYVMLIPGIVNLILFKYLPMYGIIVSFQDFVPKLGYFGSPFVGLKHFEAFFRDPFAFRVIRNTFLLGFYSLLFGFPAPILLALALNELRYPRFKRVVQTISYMPYFLSVVIVVGMVRDLVSATDGPINAAITAMGGKSISFLTSPGWFRTLYISSGIWQGIGFSSIIYLAAMAGINPEMYEAAVIDGAGRLQQVRYITLPSIAPTIFTMLILNMGSILNAGFDQIFNLYGPTTYATGDILDTYTYRVGLVNFEYSYSTAVSLFQNTIGLTMALLTNYAAKKLDPDTGLL